MPLINETDKLVTFVTERSGKIIDCAITFDALLALAGRHADGTSKLDYLDFFDANADRIDDAVNRKLAATPKHRGILRIEARDI
jgi:hypothetical protein